MKSTKLVCMSKTVFYFGCIILFLVVYLIIDKLTKHLKGDCVCPITKEDKKEDKKDIIVVDRPTQIIDSSDTQQYRSVPERE